MVGEKISPGMQQYLDVKANYPDAFLLFRMGDFYELFYEDAIEAARLLELTLTSRNKNAENPIPMAGVPYHSAQQYIDTLVELGHKVAIAEQMEDPKQAVGVVKREVVQVITPGTVVDSTKGDAESNFLVAIDRSAPSTYALAYMDVSTGQFFVTSVADFSTIIGEIRNLRAKEVVVGYDLSLEEEQILEEQLHLLLSTEKEELVSRHLISSSLLAHEQAVAGKLLAYVQKTQLRELVHLQPVSRYEIKDYLQMDFSSKASLDLLENARTGKRNGSLFWLLNETKTAMGLRLLRTWIDRPLIQKDQILQRQAVVQTFIEHFFERNDLTDCLRGVYDIERLASRVSFGKTSPKDLLQLSQTLANIPPIRSLLELMESASLSHLVAGLDPIPELHALIEAAIDPEASQGITDGNIIREGFDEQLDVYRRVMREGTGWIAEIESRERERSGIHNLKIDYNKKDGYYFHVTNSNLDSVPEHFFRKATLKNSERYGTEELAKIEGQMLEARDKSASLEYEIFTRIRQEVEKYIHRLQQLAKTVATIDVLQSFAFVAERQHLVCPQFNEQHEIEIQNGRHPVVEKVMGAQTYIPNSIHMGSGTAIQLITGPNMSGKSTYMRQLAIIVIMAQMGSYVPGEQVSLPIFDAIFTRIGAADDLVSGQSTFMVEMTEANKAIQLATENSLILFDELGRGTATYDGMALAQSIIEYIHHHIHAKTLFATHYHELTDLSETLTELENVHVETLEQNGQITFLHRIAAGPADQSYGVHVARIAGMPEELLRRAESILVHLEGTSPNQNGGREQDLNKQVSSSTNQQLDLFSTESRVVEALRALDLNQMTPLEVMLAIADLKKGL
ncbi:DNA mismatch repair protein MutS [Streptococcus sp. DD13]|uniref:DNA mismatch repair protein MutS n=1 Tax=Streptococcus sp. DD13 TaxID=1777881 RepID=UPI00079AD8BB|nr:DNA mismatch repair protein MutS [Streptococcus sp. DD13]KXT77835.1 DNA mismatch repair protein MutS [Streptococcus sp. DD13]